VSIATQRVLARAREARAIELAAQGRTTREIASALGVSQTAACNALRRAEQRALAEMLGAVQTLKVRQLGRLEHVFREALAAWERSKGDRVVKRSKQTEGKRGGPVKTAEIRTEEHAGDPRFLATALDALGAQRRVLGLDAPQQVEANVVVERPAADLTERQLAQKLAELLPKVPGR
jgi:hypothetical protein